MCVYYQFCFITGDTGSVEWRHDNNSIIIVSTSIEQCQNIVNRLKQKRMRKWCIELCSSNPESALILINNLDQLAMRELSVEVTSLDSICMSMLSKKFTKVKKLLFKFSSLPPGSIKEASEALNLLPLHLKGYFCGMFLSQMMMYFVCLNC